MIRWYKNVRNVSINLIEVDVLKNKAIWLKYVNNNRDAKFEEKWFFISIRKKGKDAYLTERVIKICWRTAGVCKVNRILFREEWLLGSRIRQPVLHEKKKSKGNCLIFIIIIIIIIF